MRRLIIATLLGALVAGTAAADEDEEAILDFGGDSFRAGGTVVFDATGTDDLFMAGETVRAETSVAGSAHVAGRRVTVSGSVGGDAYVAGMDVAVEGAVAGDASVAGYDVRVGAVGGDLRISGARLLLEGPVGGYALVAGDEVRIEGVIAGDAMLTARELEFGEGARIDGQVTVYEEDEGALTIPESVAPADRITRREIEDWEEGTAALRRWSWAAALGQFLVGVVGVAALASLVAAIAPGPLAEMRRSVLARPFHTLWFGFLTQSAVVGSGILFAMTLIGMVLTPASVLLALAGGFAGYVIGVYTFGVGLMMAFGRGEPDSMGQRALAAGVGALVAGIVVLIPFLGWLFMLALVLAGVGAITLKLFRPGFYVAG